MGKFEEVQSRLNKKTLEKIRKASDIPDIRQPLPSVGLTKALRGGLRYGTQNTFWGNRSSAKTALALGTAALAQQDGRTVALVDAEGSYTSDWGAKLGLNNEELIYAQIGSVSDCSDACRDLMESGVDVIIVDSISALLPQSYFDDSGDMKDLENTGQIGQFSKDIGKMANMINYANRESLIIHISQVRTDLSGYHASLKPMGGKAMDHANTTSIKLTASMSDDKAIKGKVENEHALIEKNVGRNVAWQIAKERGPGMGETGNYDFYYDGDFIGIDNVGELIEYGVLYGVIKKGGAWLTFGENKFQGKAKMVEWLRSSPEDYEILKAAVM